MKSLSYLFTAALLLSTSPLIGMEPADQAMSLAKKQNPEGDHPENHAPIAYTPKVVETIENGKHQGKKSAVTAGIFLLSPDVYSYFHNFLDANRLLFQSNKLCYTFICKMQTHLFSSSQPFCPTHAYLTDDFISQFQNLTSLNITRGIKVTDASVSKLTNLTYLKPNSFITDASVSKLTNLTSLNTNSLITDTSVSELTKLTSLTLFCTRTITDASVSKLTKLTYLDTNYNGMITDTSVSELTNLTSLIIANNKNITGMGIVPLTNLTFLNLSGCTKPSTYSVSKLTNLMYLRINSLISDTHLSHLTNLTDLRFVR